MQRFSGYVFQAWLGMDDVVNIFEAWSAEFLVSGLRRSGPCASHWACINCKAKGGNCIRSITVLSIVAILHTAPTALITALFFFAKCLWNPMQAQVPPLTSEGSAISSSFLYLGFVVKRDQSHPAMIKTGSTAKNTSLSVLSHQRMGRFNPIQNIQETCGSKHLQNNANINTWPINMTHGLQTYDIPQFHPHIGVTTSTAFPSPKKDGSGWRSCACCSSRGSTLPWRNGGCWSPWCLYWNKGFSTRFEACLNIDTGKKEGSCGNSR